MPNARIARTLEANVLDPVLLALKAGVSVKLVLQALEGALAVLADLQGVKKRKKR
jgi:hypothetical protein